MPVADVEDEENEGKDEEEDEEEEEEEEEEDTEVDTEDDLTQGVRSLRLARRILGGGHDLAVGETVILPHPPSTFSRCFNRDEKGVPSKWQSRRRLSRPRTCRRGPSSPCGLRPNRSLNTVDTVSAEGEGVMDPSFGLSLGGWNARRNFTGDGS